MSEIAPLYIDRYDISEMNYRVIYAITKGLTGKPPEQKIYSIKIYPRIIQIAEDFEHYSDEIPGFSDDEDVYEFAETHYMDVLNDIREISGLQDIDTWDYIKSFKEFWMSKKLPDSYDFFMDAINLGFCSTDGRKLVAKFLCYYAITETFKKIVELYKGQQ